jgi:S-methylmethionine-dependent homocysteine/selenocysteine methylase
MSEDKLIQQAYEDFIKNLFKTFYEAYTTSKNSKDEAAAERVFTKAVKIARDARDRAISIVPP